LSFLIGASVLWAFSFGLIKGQLTGLDPVMVACVRLLLAGVVFLPMVIRGRLARTLIARAAVLGAVQFGLMYVLYISSYKWLAAWQVAVLTIFTPLYVALFAALSDRRFSVREIVGTGVAIIGASLVVRGDVGDAAWRGMALLQGANLCFAYGQWHFRRLSHEAGGNDAALVGWMTLAGAGVTLAAVMVRAHGQPLLFAGWHQHTVWTLLYLGVLPTGLGFFLWNRGAARSGAGTLAVANNLKIPLAVFVSWTVFGEDVPYLRVIAALLLIGGALGLVRLRQPD